jgi:hypothetical protein
MVRNYGGAGFAIDLLAEKMSKRKSPSTAMQ